MTEKDAPIQSAVPAPGLKPVELAHDLLSRIERGNTYARTRKKRFRRSSAVVRLTTLTLLVASTIILGLQNLDFWAGLGFSLVAVVTVVNTLEPFFAWRSRWVLMEETQYQFYRLRDELTTTSQQLNLTRSIQPKLRKCLINTNRYGIGLASAGWSTGSHPELSNSRCVPGIGFLIVGKRQTENVEPTSGLMHSSAANGSSRSVMTVSAACGYRATGADDYLVGVPAGRRCGPGAGRSQQPARLIRCWASPRLEIIWRMRSAWKIMRVTAYPTQVAEAATVDLPQSAAVVWSFMADPASSTHFDVEVEAAVTLPGSPAGLGEIQVFLQRTPGGRDIAALEVIELEPDRRAVTRSLTATYPSYGILTVEPLGSDSCRLTQEHRIYLPVGTPVATVRHLRDHLKATVHALTTQLVLLAPRLSAADTSDEPTSGTTAAFPADGPPDAQAMDKATAWIRTETEVLRRRRRARLGGAMLAILTTGLVVAATAGSQSYPRPENGTFWILAVAMVLGGAALAGVIRLLSAMMASASQWLHRYTAGVLLLAPAALILTGRFTARRDINECGTLLDRNHWTAAIADVQRDCAAAAQSRLRDVIVWLAGGSLAATVYGLQLRRRRRASRTDTPARP